MSAPEIYRMKVNISLGKKDFSPWAHFNPIVNSLWAHHIVALSQKREIGRPRGDAKRDFSIREITFGVTLLHFRFRFPPMTSALGASKCAYPHYSTFHRTRDMHEARGRTLRGAIDQEAKNRLNAVLREKVHREISERVNNISDTL